MYKINYTKESEDNLTDIFDYISNDNIFYAVKVLQSIKTTIDILKLFPLSGASIDEKIKMIIDSKYKYRIIYNFDGKEILVLSIGKYKNTWF